MTDLLDTLCKHAGRIRRTRSRAIDHDCAVAIDAAIEYIVRLERECAALRLKAVQSEHGTRTGETRD